MEPEQAVEVAVALRDSLGLLVRRFRQSKIGGDLTLPEASAIARLARFGPATAARLAKAEQISPQSIGVTLAGLEARGLIERRADPEDGRRVVLSITEAGSAAREARRDARSEQLAHALAAGFTPAEVKQLVAVAPLLERLAQAL